MSARTILNPPNVNELNGLFNGTGSISCSSVSLTNGSDSVELVCGGSNTLNVNAIYASGVVDCAQVGIFDAEGAGVALTCTGPNTLTSTARISAPSFAGGLWGGTVNFSNPLSIGGAGVTGFSFTLPVVPPAGSTLSDIAFSFSPIATTSQSEFVTSYNVAYNTGDAFCTIYLYVYQPVSVSSELAAVRYIAYNGTTSTTTLTLLT